MSCCDYADKVPLIQACNGMFTPIQNDSFPIEGSCLLPLVKLTMSLRIVSLQPIRIGLLAEIGICTCHESQPWA